MSGLLDRNLVLARAFWEGPVTDRLTGRVFATPLAFASELTLQKLELSRPPPPDAHVEAWLLNKRRAEVAADAAAWKIEWEAGRAAREARTQERKAKREAKRMAVQEWRAGVARIMAEVRRREIERNGKPRFRVPAISVRAPTNPLDGTRLWENS